MSTTHVPQTALPLLPLFRGVIFPGTLATLPVGRPSSVALVESLRPGALVGVAAQLDPEVESPTLDELYPVATLARVQQLVRLTNGRYRITLQGLERFRLMEVEQEAPFLTARGESVEETGHDSDEAHALMGVLREELEEAVREQGGTLGALSQAALAPGLFADSVASELGLDTQVRAELLGELSIPDRLRRVAELVRAQVTRREVKATIEEEVRRELGKGQREAILREQLRAIQRELGDEDEERDALRAQLDEAALPEEVRKVAEREWRRLQSLNPAQPEHGVIRTYLEWIAALPWGAPEAAPIDLSAIEQRLEQDHFGLRDAKQRILEHMAVLKVSGHAQATILCLAGPPGVGKTSLAQSVADAIDRPLVRISLGGVRDEAEIRGHRRTYVGALPGRILNAMRKAGATNPVIVLDEIDKLAQGWMGSPESALLEVLDPEQNKTFTDHYLELEYDLSNALFICTANDLSAMSGPLRDRLEIIEVSGYTPSEKVHIARDHLLPRQLERHGIAPDALTIDDETIRALITDYTREAGVRQLQRELTRLCRALTLEIARSDADPASIALEITPETLGRHLGKTRFHAEVAARTASPGVATGLAWTPVGGDILFIETTKMPGKGRLEITGQLGDVMKESARAALAYVRTHAHELEIDADFLDAWDLHLHVPAGGVPKDGPSAGVTIFTALTSLLSGRRVRPDTAMTGECSLRGRVLPVGGIKAKVLAAHRAGIKRVILPRRNARDLDEIPQSTLDELEIILADDMREVLAAALATDDHDTLTAELITRDDAVAPLHGAGG